MRLLRARVSAGCLEILRPAGAPRDLAALGRAAARAGLRQTDEGWRALRPQDLLAAAPALREAGWDLAPDEAAAATLAAAEEAQGEGWRPPGFALVREALQRKGRDFRPYQVEGARWLGRERGAILADSPGLGKTIQLLALLEPEVGRAVVVGPKNAIPEWTAQVREYRPDLRAVKAKGRGGMPAPQPGEVCLGTLESLAPAPPELAGALLACDEAHALKGDTAQRDRFCAWSRAALAAGGRVVLLTGTPILNADPTELWRMLDAAGRAEDTLGPLAGLRALFAHEVEALEVPDRSPRAKAAVQRILDQHGARSFAQLPKAERDRALALSYRRVERVRWSGDHSPEVGDRLRRAVLRRTKEQVARDLPPLQRADRAARIAPGALAELQAADVARRLAERLAAAEDASERGDVEALEALAESPAIATARRLLASAKLPALGDLLDELEAAGEPALVFSAHVAPLLQVVAERGEGWGAIHGGTSEEARAELRDRFQAGDLRGLALSIRAASEALTLTRSAYVVFLDLDWVPAKNEQAEARAHRLGQARPVTVLRLVADHPVDRRIAALLRDKGQFQARLLAAMEGESGHAAAA